MKAFDGYTKDGAPYIFEYTTKAENFGAEFQKKQVLYLAVKGKIGAGTILEVDVLFDENGKTALYEFELANTDTDYIIASVSNPLGQTALGTEPLGGTIEEQSDLNFFHVVFAIPQKAYPYTVQATFRTSNAGARCVVDAHAWYIEDAKAKPFKLKGSS